MVANGSYNILYDVHHYLKLIQVFGECGGLLLKYGKEIDKGLVYILCKVLVTLVSVGLVLISLRSSMEYPEEVIFSYLSLYSSLEWSDSLHFPMVTM